MPAVCRRSRTGSARVGPLMSWRSTAPGPVPLDVRSSGRSRHPGTDVCRPPGWADGIRRRCRGAASAADEALREVALDLVEGDALLGHRVALADRHGVVL